MELTPLFNLAPTKSQHLESSHQNVGLVKINDGRYHRAKICYRGPTWTHAIYKYKYSFGIPGLKK